MTEQEANIKALREGYELWNGSKAGSAAHWMSLISDDICWRSLGAGAAGAEFTTACNSKEQVQRYFQTLGEQWELLGYVVDEFVAQGDRIVMLGSCHWKHRGTGKEVHSPKADVFRFRDGKVVDFMEYYDTAMAAAATT